MGREHSGAGGAARREQAGPGSGNEVARAVQTDRAGGGAVKLAQTQQRLWSAIAHGLEGGAAGAAAIVAAGANLSAERRGGVYAALYFLWPGGGPRGGVSKVGALLGGEGLSRLAAPHIPPYP